MEEEDCNTTTARLQPATTRQQEATTQQEATARLGGRRDPTRPRRQDGMSSNARRRVVARRGALEQGHRRLGGGAGSRTPDGSTAWWGRGHGVWRGGLVRRRWRSRRPASGEVLCRCKAGSSIGQQQRLDAGGAGQPGTEGGERSQRTSCRLAGVGSPAHQPRICCAAAWGPGLAGSRRRGVAPRHHGVARRANTRSAARRGGQRGGGRRPAVRHRRGVESRERPRGIRDRGRLGT
jgi:hypothetical protein